MIKLWLGKKESARRLKCLYTALEMMTTVVACDANLVRNSTSLTST